VRVDGADRQRKPKSHEVRGAPKVKSDAPLLVTAVRLGRELDDGVQRDLDVRQVGLRQVVEVRIAGGHASALRPEARRPRAQAAQDRLVADDQDVLLALELHDDGLEADDDVAVGLAAAVAVVVLVLVAVRKVVRVRGLDLLVRHAVAHARVELVERLPRQLRVG
jgi:hypothetical protein